MVIEDKATQVAYACKCLNVRVTPFQSPSEGSDYPHNPNYIPVFVRDDSIQVNHPQVTVRLKSRPEPIPGTSRYSRFTTLQCLFCALPVYRVHHAISLEVEGNETTLLPSEDWVEREVLKSGTGWIDVHKECLTRDDVCRALSSPAYASVFGILLPETSTPPSSPEPTEDDDELSSTKGKQKEDEEETTTYLPNMKPVFLPPPFTSSNPIFVHLASTANKQSQELQAAADERIRDFIQAEVTGIIEQQRIIRRQAQSIWKEFRRHLADLQLERGRHVSRTARSPSRSKDAVSMNGLVSPRGISSSVAIRNFIPTPMSSSPRHAASPPRPRVSALSASLATSIFYHPNETRRRDPSSDLASISPKSCESHALSTQSGSLTLVHSAYQGEGSNVLQFRRTFDEDINTQASYNYFVSLDEEMQRYKRSKEEKFKTEEPEVLEPLGFSATTSNRNTVGMDSETPQTSETGNQPQEETTPLRGRDKGKRKVTFDVKPAVVTIEKDEGAEEEETVGQDHEIIFPLDEVMSEAEGNTTEDQKNTLPLLEQPPPRPVSIKKRAVIAGSDAFHSLRPASLPAPSHIRPIRSPPGVGVSSQIVISAHLKSLPSTATSSKTLRREPSPIPLSERDAELLKLVAADMPSHRGAWLPGSENWKIFTGHRNTKDDTDEENQSDDKEEAAKSAPIIPTFVVDDTEDSTSPVVGSLPIKIRKIETPKPLSLASYVGQDVGPEQVLTPPAVLNGKKHSSTAIRKAAYLERDRSRAIDPGPLDSVLEEDEAEDEDDVAGVKNEGEKARKQALRILKARSELPEEGMWRSLA